jgi:GDPmannose 4,6-dehydratase
VQVDLLLGDPAKAKAKLGWTASIRFEQLAKEMVLADLALVDKGDMTS